MDTKPGHQIQCDSCLWWVPTSTLSGTCPHRTAAMGSNAEWRQISLGRCAHYLAIPDQEQTRRP